MKTNTKIKNLLCYVVAFLLAIVANFGLISFKKNKNVVFATVVSEADSEPLTLANNNFSLNPKSTYPFEPKEYTISNSDSNVDSGVINVEDEKYAKRFSNLDRGTLYDNYVLMIDSSKKPTDLGYTTSGNISLDAGGTYLISVDVYTAEGGIANLVLSDGEEEFSTFTNIVSNNRWTSYYFFIKNDNVDSENLKLGMYLKSQGVAMFDNINTLKINENEFNRLTTEELTSTEYKVINNRKNVLQDYTSIKLKDVFSDSNGASSIKYDLAHTDGYHSNALKITNTQPSFINFESTEFAYTEVDANDPHITNVVKSEYLTLEQNGVYNITVNAKAEDLNGKATIGLVQIVDEDETAVEKTLTISASTTSKDSITNGFKQYSFYVTTSPEESASFKLVASLGSDSEKATGSLYISSVEISRITTSAYSAASAGAEVEKIDFSTDYKLTGSSTALDNGKFDIISANDQNKQYPASANGWSVETGEHTQHYGIVNTSSTEFAKLSGFKNLTNPMDTRNGGTKINNNILMMHNTQADVLSYKSTSKNLSAKSIHKFETSINTQNSPVTLSLVATVEGKEIVLSSKTVDTNGDWAQVEMYIKAGYAALDVSLKIILDSSSWAYAYVDNARFDYYSQPTEEQFNAISATDSNLVSKVDLTNILLTKDNNDFATPMLFESTGDNVTFGVVDVEYGPYKEIETFTAIGESHVIGISAMNDSYSKVNSILGYKLAKNSYYKVSVSVYTQYLQIINGNGTSFGAGIKLSSFDETFTNIQSNNTWTTYNFYVCPDNDTTTYLELLLGSEDCKVSGDAFFGKISFTEINEDTFNKATANEYSKILKTTAVATPEETPVETPTETTNFKDINWWYVISGSMFTLAIIITIVGVMVRRIKWKKPVKKTKNSYDRNRTVSKQVYTRKATTVREEKLRELNKDLETLHAERIKYEEEYKQDLTKLREMKIKRANPADIKKLEKEMRKSQKMSSSIGVNINAIEAEIKYVNTDAYFNSLMKKLANQPSQNSQQEE
ncbi:MAG: hypothetical protein IKM43_02375 [Clostridia bacterium]|nr:hypothetical protein [Clostridia bacterium]